MKFLCLYWYISFKQFSPNKEKINHLSLLKQKKASDILHTQKKKKSSNLLFSQRAIQHTQIIHMVETLLKKQTEPNYATPVCFITFALRTTYKVEKGIKYLW